MKQKNLSILNSNILTGMYKTSIPSLSFPCCWEDQPITAVPIHKKEKSPCKVLFNHYYTNLFIKVCKYKRWCICKSSLKHFNGTILPNIIQNNFCLNLFSIQQYQLFILERTSSSSLKMLGNTLFNCCSREGKEKKEKKPNQDSKPPFLHTTSVTLTFFFCTWTFALRF